MPFDNERIQELSQSTGAALTHLNGAPDGMKAYHNSIAGHVVLLYSPTEQADIKARKEKYQGPLPEAAGCCVALNVTDGKLYRYTDIEVLEGNRGIIDYQLNPNFDPFVTKKFYPDSEKLGVVDPRNLVRLSSAYGDTGCIPFEDANPRNGSLVGYYGREKALEIVEMIRGFDPAIQPVRVGYNRPSSGASGGPLAGIGAPVGASTSANACGSATSGATSGSSAGSSAGDSAPRPERKLCAPKPRRCGFC